MYVLGNMSLEDFEEFISKIGRCPTSPNAKNKWPSTAFDMT